MGKWNSQRRSGTSVPEFRDPVVGVVALDLDGLNLAITFILTRTATVTVRLWDLADPESFLEDNTDIWEAGEQVFTSFLSFEPGHVYQASVQAEGEGPHLSNALEFNP